MTREIRDRAHETKRLALTNIKSDQLIEPFLDSAARIGPLDFYKILPRAALNLLEEIRALEGETGLRAFLRAALSQAVIRTVDSRALLALPDAVKRHQLVNLSRIASDADFDAKWLDASNDLFQKDFGLANLRLYAAGSALIDYRCAISRSILAREGFAAIPRKLATFIWLGGLQPYFGIHTHLFYLDHFNEEGWNDCYRCCAQLYNFHPTILGMFGCSWFYDPGLDSISPRLSYLRDVPMSAGARLMFLKTGGEAIANATAKSSTRRKLYEEGKYQPKNYLLVWGKEDQIKWAKAHPTLEGA